MTVRGIAVFGSSEPGPGSPLFEQAAEIGRRLARAGHTATRLIAGEDSAFDGFVYAPRGSATSP